MYIFLYKKMYIHKFEKKLKKYLNNYRLLNLNIYSHFR